MSDSKTKKIGIIQLVIVLLVVAFTFALSISLKPEPQAQSAGGAGQGQPDIKVAITSVAVESYSPTLTLTGVVVAGTQTDLAPQVRGLVTHVSPSLRPGGQFKKGDILFTIEKADFTLAVDRSKAEVAAATSDLTYQRAIAAIAESDWAKLFPNQEITPLGARKPQVDAAEARLAAAKAAQKEAELALSRTTVIAPFDGRVISTKLDVGQNLAANQSVGQIYALDRLEIEAPIAADETDLIAPLKGKQVVYTGGKGTITRLSAQLDPRTRQAMLFIAPNVDQSSAEALLVGRFLSLDIQGDTVDRATRLPASFVSMGEVWTVQNGLLQPMDLDVLGYEGDDIIVRAFAGMDAVVTALPPRAKQGMKVLTVADTKNQKSPSSRKK